MDLNVLNIRLVSTLAVAAAAVMGVSAPAADVDFAAQVRPVLSNYCFRCHGPDEATREADLRLDIASELDTSVLLERILSADPDIQMPPPDSGLALSKVQKSLLQQWVAAGGQRANHWSFRPVVRPPVPDRQHPVDSFVQRRLQIAGLTPADAASRPTLIRRLFLDLTGLPPTPTEVDAFVNDDRTDAWDQLVDRTLASPHYGEKWGRHWLDQARYADTNGYTVDSPRSMWPWRDWVVRAINVDMPFDQFTIEQLAGDLLDSPTPQQLIATGFHRNTLINQEGGSDKEQFRNEAVVDRTNTTGAVWMGLTVGCAQCHTHKYDPLTHHEYYSLFAFFNSDKDINSTSPTVSVPTAAHEAEVGKLRQAIATAQQHQKEFRAAHPDDTLTDALRQQQAMLRENIKQAKNAEKKFQKSIPTTMVMRARPEPRDTHVLTRGDFLRPADRVQPDGPAFLPQMAPSTAGKIRTRLDLARWLVSRPHPLTARVTVNRVWLQLFGRGLVETENDFGLQGTPPTHPFLLDWLAAEFMENGWSRKRLIRTIVTSEAYRQSSVSRAESAAVDPLNKLLSRQSRVRVDAEIVRDLTLAVSGLLNRQIGGPGVYPPQPDGVYAFTQRQASWPTSEGADRYRRGMYTFFMRSAPHPMLTTFDTPFFNTTCTRRVRSNTPLQSLTMANDVAFVEASQALSIRVLKAGSSDDDCIAHAWKLCFARRETTEEHQRCLNFLAAARSQLAETPAEAGAIAGASADSENTVRRAAWTMLARGLLNLDEFITRE